MCKVNNCTRPLYKAGYCKTHSPERQREYRKANAERFKGYTLKRDYDLSLDEYQELLERQGGCCAICGTPDGAERGNNNGSKRLSVDHDHTTGVVRGLLCGSCNQALGQFQDNTEWLWKAIEYLQANRKLQKAVSDAVNDLLSDIP